MQNPNQDDRKPTAPQTEEEKLEFLRREEIRTMIKDVSKLREMEAQKERERLSSIKPPAKEAEVPPVAPPPSPTTTPRYSNIPPQQTPQGQAPVPPQTYQAPQQPSRPTFAQPAPARPSFNQPTSAQPVPTQPAPVRPAPVQPAAPKAPSVQIMPQTSDKKTALVRKILARTIAIAILIFILGFLGWYFFARTQGEQKKEPVATTTEQVIVDQSTTTEPVVEAKEMVIYPSLIPTVATETLEVASSSEILSLLPNILKRNFSPGFTRILIKNTTENRPLNIRDVFQISGVSTPEGFLDKINIEGTLFIYSTGAYNRLGFVAETNDPTALINAALAWEKTIEKDMNNLYSILGKTGNSTISSFKKADYKNTSFRYISFPPANFGICWSISDNYFVWTSSGESMTKTLDLLIK